MEQLPSKSPDCHKVVEHPIHPIKARFRDHFTQLAGKVSHTRAMELLQECVKENFVHCNMIKDIASMKSTLESIINKWG